MKQRALDPRVDLRRVLVVITGLITGPCPRVQYFPAHACWARALMRGVLLCARRVGAEHSTRGGPGLVLHEEFALSSLLWLCQCTVFEGFHMPGSLSPNETPA